MYKSEEWNLRFIDDDSRRAELSVYATFESEGLPSLPTFWLARTHLARMARVPGVPHKYYSLSNTPFMAEQRRYTERKLSEEIDLTDNSR